MYGCVYITTNHVNNKKYIGKCLYDRINNWENYLGSGKELKEDIKKYGKHNFSKQVIDEAGNKEDLERLEEYYISKYNAVVSDEYYNLKYSAVGGDTFTHNPNKENIRQIHSNNAKAENNPQYEQEKTDRFLESVKKANSKPVSIGGLEYPSAIEASRQLGIKPTTVHYRLDSDSYPSYIRLVPKEKKPWATYRNKKIPVVIMGVEYESIAEAARQLGCSPTKIRKRLEFDDDYSFVDCG